MQLFLVVGPAKRVPMFRPTIDSLFADEACSVLSQGGYSAIWLNSRKPIPLAGKALRFASVGRNLGQLRRESKSYFS